MLSKQRPCEIKTKRIQRSKQLAFTSGQIVFLQFPLTAFLNSPHTNPEDAVVDWFTELDAEVDHVRLRHKV